jgi:putative membrane protein
MKAVTGLSFIAAALLTVVGVAGAQGVSDADREFMRKAAQGGAAEVELGTLATQRAARPAVRDFGARMVKDHGAANAELATLARAKGVELPTTPDPTHRAVRDRLMALQGPDFDRAYLQEMVKDHTQDVAEFERASQTASDADLRTWAASKVPILREHLALAREVNSQVVLGPAPAAPAPAAIAAAVLVPWCGGAYAPGNGTNFGTCIPVVK